MPCRDPSKQRGYDICAIQNIPGDFTAPDLRYFFSDFIERGLFTCFHFISRPPRSSSAAKTCLVKIQRGTSARHDTHLNEFVSKYHGILWESRRPHAGAYNNDALRKVFISKVTQDTPRPSNSRRGKQRARAAALDGRGRRNDLLFSRTTKTHSQLERDFLLPRHYSSPSTFQRRSEARSGDGGAGTAGAETAVEGSQQGPSQRRGWTYRDMQGQIAVVDPSCHRDFLVPAELPQGNVGTPTKVVEDAINRCVLRVSTLKMLGGSLNYDFRRSTKRKYGEVPYVYSAADPTPVADAPPDDKRRTRTGCERHGEVSISTKHPEPQRVCNDASVMRSAAIPRSGTSDPGRSNIDYDSRQPDPTGVSDDGDSASSDDGDDAQEWERHNDLHGIDEAFGYKYRTHTQARDAVVFEDTEATDHSLGGRIWDKGDASGLVHYTDDMYWESNAVKGDFDERNTDDWDVEYEEDTSGARRSADAASRPKTRERGSSSTSSKVATKFGRPQHKVDAFDKYCARGFGGRYLRKYGWKSEAERTRLYHNTPDVGKAFAPSPWTRSAAKSMLRAPKSKAAARRGIGFVSTGRCRDVAGDGGSGRVKDVNGPHKPANHVSRFLSDRHRREREGDNPFPIGSIFDVMPSAHAAQAACSK